MEKNFIEKREMFIREIVIAAEVALVANNKRFFIEITIEHFFGAQGVAGSIPAAQTKFYGGTP